MSESPSFEAWLETQQDALKAWGRFVVEKVEELVELDLGAEGFKVFFKVRPSSRVKEIPSALAKQVKKSYADPTQQMTDLVGARFVVLLRTDLEVVERVLVAYSGWSRSKDRNPEDERDADPTNFDYQSVHYLVHNNQARDIGGIQIPEGMCCEVQIRTLLQHAYAELVHDKFYKAKEDVPPSALRLVARCMALMETTDEMFCAAVRELEQVNQTREQWCALVDSQMGGYLPMHTPTAFDHDALEIIEKYMPLLAHANVADVKAMLDPTVVHKVQQRASAGGLFEKPVVLLVYWLAKHHAFEVTQSWPVPALQAGLDQVKSDVGRG